MPRISAGMCLIALSVLGLAAMRVGFAAPEKDKAEKAEKAEKEVPKVLVITEADKGKTIRVQSGKPFDIELVGDLPRTGWYSQPIEGKGTARVGEKPGERPRLADFTAAKDAKDESQGTYLFRYEAVAPGKSQLKFVYFKPGGPNPFGYPALAVQKVREIEFTIEVFE